MDVTIVVVDDNPNVLSFVRPVLEHEGYRVFTEDNGDAALYRIETTSPDLVVLDIEMPGLNGLAVCRKLRQDGNKVPVIFLTVRDSVTDLEMGFDFGASDYMTKPFDVRELLARIKARLPPRHLQIAEYLRIDTYGHNVWVREDDAWKDVSLTPKEYSLLRYLAYNAGRAIGKTTLLEQVFDYPEQVETKTLEKHIWSLRQKLEPDPKSPRYIINVRGVGYKLEDYRH